MNSRRVSLVAFFAIVVSLAPLEASAVVTVFFSPDQIATPAGTGVVSDAISCEGYLFVYTRDKLFTGAVPTPLGGRFESRGPLASKPSTSRPARTPARPRSRSRGSMAASST